MRSLWRNKFPVLSRKTAVGGSTAVFLFDEVAKSGETKASPYGATITWIESVGRGFTPAVFCLSLYVSLPRKRKNHLQTIVSVLELDYN